MTKEEILSNLCYYDERNPDNGLEFISEKEEFLKDHNKYTCFCDNCFRGKTKLAEYILKLQEELDLYDLP